MSSANITQIATVANGVISLISVGQEIYELTVKSMDAVEALKGIEKGEDKKAWVLAFVKDFVLSLNENWDHYINIISDFIDKIKKMYNTIKDLIK